MQKSFMLIVGLSLIAVTAGRAAEVAKEETPAFSLGTRASYFWLTDSHREGTEKYLGHIADESENQDLIPYKAFARYAPCAHAFIELSIDRVAADTINDNDGQASDGEVDLMGPSLTANYTFDAGHGLSPYVGAGVGYWFAEFHQEPWHRNGYPSPEAYEDAKTKRSAYHGLQRHITADDGVGFIAQTGCSAKFQKDWFADVNVRYVEVSSDAHYTSSFGDEPGNTIEGEFSLDHIALAIGVGRQF